MTEKETVESTVKLANLILGRPYNDPDDDLAVLSRQFLRALERLKLSQAHNERHADRADKAEARARAAEDLINLSRPECTGGHATLCGICHACKALAAWRKVRES